LAAPVAVIATVSLALSSRCLQEFAQAAASARVKNWPSRTKPATTLSHTALIWPRALRAMAQAAGRLMIRCIGAMRPSSRRDSATSPVASLRKAGTNVRLVLVQHLRSPDRPPESANCRFLYALQQLCQRFAAGLLVT